MNFYKICVRIDEKSVLIKLFEIWIVLFLNVSIIFEIETERIMEESLKIQAF